MFMKNLIVTLILASVITTAYSQNQSNKEIVSDTHNRSSLSVVTINYDDKYDQEVNSMLNEQMENKKYDLNSVPTTTLSSSSDRICEKEKKERLSEMDSLVTQSNIGKEILSFWFKREFDGSMYIERILERGMYNATDVDLIRSQAINTGIASVKDKGFELIKNSYVIVLDYVRRYNVYAKAHVLTLDVYFYQLDYTPEIESQLFNCWIYPEDTPSVRVEKIKAFENLEIPLKRMNVQSKVVSKSEDESMSKSMGDAFASAFIDIENSIDALLVKSAVVGVRPVVAKIGTKEGLKKKDLFYAYQYRESREGEIYSKNRGVLRAISVANNDQVATGDTPTSSFYQIAGGEVKPGYILREKNDWGLGVSVGYQIGALEGICLDIDQLLTINNRGISQYILMDFSGNYYKTSSVYKHIGAFNFNLGYAVGFRFVRILELKLNLSAGLDLLKDSETTEKISGYTYSVIPGATLNVNIAYPLHLFVGLDYRLKITPEDSDQTIHYNNLESHISSRKGVTVSAGLRFVF